MMPLALAVARRVLPRAVRARIRWRPRPAPVNFRRRDASPAAIESDVAYALMIGQSYLDCLAAAAISPVGKAVLELGPGINCGAMLLLACHGARPIVADRFLGGWDRRYHPKFYGALRDRLAAREPAPDLGPLDRLLALGDYPERDICRIRCPAEDLHRLPAGVVDVTLSNAVLEHVADFAAVSRELARVSGPSAWGFHLVDFRYHVDFDKPLEHLLLDTDDFARIFDRSHGECGTRWRPAEMAHMFEEAGFTVSGFETVTPTPPEYLRDFEPRLRCSDSRYRDAPIAELEALTGRFILRRRAEPDRR